MTILVKLQQAVVSQKAMTLTTALHLMYIRRSTYRNVM
jgi:hypothetical protein